jgi:hypothetical protein
VAVHQSSVTTERGDQVILTLFTHAGEEPTILVSVIDADNSAHPTAEFTLPDAGEFRDLLRKLCEQGSRHACGR